MSASVFILPIDCADTKNMCANNAALVVVHRHARAFKCTVVSSLINIQHAVINCTFASNFLVYRTNRSFQWESCESLRDTQHLYTIILNEIKQASLLVMS